MLYFHTMSLRISIHLLSCWPPAEVENSYTKKSANVLTCATRALAPILSNTLAGKKKRKEKKKPTSNCYVLNTFLTGLFYKS